MAKIALVVIIAMIAVTYFNDPASFKPWVEVTGRASVVVAKAVKDSGEAANKYIRDEAHKDSVVEKAKDAVSDASDSVKQAVTGK